MAKDRVTSDNYKVVIHPDRVPRGGHERRFNASPTNEIAAVVVNSEQIASRDIVIQAHDVRLTRVPDTHRFYEALEYPTIFVKDKRDTQSNGKGYPLYKPRAPGRWRPYDNSKNPSINKAVWRILCLPLHERHPTVTHLAIHLPNVQGLINFLDLKAVDGQELETFPQACEKLGLLEDDDHWDAIIE
ncbi:hypothetical protein EVAR_12809_1 [Eumeta japonica]|uniref:Uncharacterized protein n=1 Tax=Eumeta variegata TaxID=151549 RepID=A0A4C1UB18_EUMVA|nr:hypothetical protein EVAR_12809_1 [Eumeta japonica]